jgi:hypothetical protein
MTSEALEMTSRPRRSSVRRTLVVIASLGLLPTLAACPKKTQPAVPDAEPPPPAVDAAPTVLEPLVEDAGVDAADAAKKATGGHAVDPTIARLKQCCAALAKQAKENGNPPDIMPAVNTCNQVSAQLAANPNAPELNAVRPLLKMVKNLPALCQGL